MSATPKPSATVVLLRDGPAGLEVLLLQRAPRADGRPGPFVFPGGKVEPEEAAAASGDPVEAARRAAVRETREEAGLRLDPHALVLISRWITPEVAPRRFDTWFFAAPLTEDASVQVCGSEIVAHRWIGPVAALAEHRADRVRLAPPTFVTVSWLADYPRAAAACRALGDAPTQVFRPRICRVEEGACMLYPGDAGYESGAPRAPGPRHRLFAGAEGYRYERSQGPAPAAGPRRAPHSNGESRSGS